MNSDQANGLINVYMVYALIYINILIYFLLTF